ncbi:MAG: DUF4919 domain-containing protein [Alistipes sp.]|nr:DUF4919 domain-containing protein [Alistipes sp.]
MLLVPLSAQDRVVVPTEDEILSHTLDTSSPYYYTNLMLKYRSGTEQLTADEYYYLYYGYYFSDEYRPFVENKAFDALMEVMAGLDPQQPTIGQLEILVERGAEALEVDPFSPKVLNIMAYAYGALGDKEREVLYFNYLNGILGAIERSGTGLKEESAWHILMFSHAYDLLASKEYNYNEARIISRSVEFVPLRGKSHDGIKGFYFDYSRIYSNKPDDVSFKKDRTWQINNLPPTEYK